VSIEAFPCVLRIEATVPVKAAEGLFVGRWVSNACQFDELGRLILLLYRCSLHVATGEYS
jgi:hypothetical protein